jgi:hypothetical protein
MSSNCTFIGGCESPHDGALCTRCAIHCDSEACLQAVHVLVRKCRKDAAQGRQVCYRTRQEVLDSFDGECPCERSILEHARGLQRARVEQPVVVPVSNTGGTAKSFGISQQQFAVHPVNFTVQRWGECLQSIVGSSAQHRMLDHFRQKLQKAAVKIDDDLQTRELAGRCTLPGGGVREFAGLLAVMTAVAARNVTASPGDQILVDRKVLCEGTPGTILAENALEEVAVQRLLREGKKFFLTEVTAFREAQRGATTQYIRANSKGVKQRIIWPDRYTRVLLNSYLTFLNTRPATFVPEPLAGYLAADWFFPLQDTAAEIDLTGIFVQMGVLSLLEQGEKFAVIGGSLTAVRAHLVAIYGHFQEKFVSSSANVHENKAFKEPPAPATGQAAVVPRPAAGGGAGGGGRGLGTHTPASVPAHQSSTAALAANIPQALAAGIRGDVYVYRQCQATGCAVVPPQGFTTSRYCQTHIPARGGGAAGGGAGRGNDARGGRGGRRNR